MGGWRGEISQPSQPPGALEMVVGVGRAARGSLVLPRLPADRDPWGPSLAEDSSFAWGRPCSGALQEERKHVRGEKGDSGPRMSR